MIINYTSQAGTIGSIDIPSPGFFFMLRPWGKGTLITMDGRARFAKITFVGDSQIRITPLVDFPGERIDPSFAAAPEADICVTQSGGLFHIADLSTKKTKSFGPFFNWRYSQGIADILDPINGIIIFSYNKRENRNDDGYMPYYHVIYDPKSDEILYESPEKGESIGLLFGFTREIAIARERSGDNKREIFLYNWETKEITRNELTKKLTNLSDISFFEAGCNISINDKYLFTKLQVVNDEPRKTVKMTWDENYEDVRVITLDYLVPEGKRFNDFFISVDGKWATSFIGGYRGYYEELLVKRAFFHMDDRYPNGISMPVFVDDYDEWRYDWGSFVEHPIHGLCFVEEKRVQEKLYLRLYKMNDVLAEINRQLLETASDVMSTN
ncbi:MAG: hypothetical protein FWG99_11925 [Treponema sp.]|nr:hypothetical protein [Treponema sp.]